MLLLQCKLNKNSIGRKFFEDRINKFLELVQKRDLKPFPFIIEFLKEHKDSLSFMLVTSQIPTVVNNLLSFWNFDEYFSSQNRFFCHDGVYKKPEIYRNVAKCIGIESITPDEVILFEDSPHYIQEAKRVGISVIGIKHRYNASTLTSCDAILTSESQDKKINPEAAAESALNEGGISTEDTTKAKGAKNEHLKGLDAKGKKGEK